MTTFDIMTWLKDYVSNGYIIRLYKGDDETFVIDYGRNLDKPRRRVFKDEKELREVLEPRLGAIELLERD